MSDYPNETKLSKTKYEHLDNIQDVQQGLDGIEGSSPDEASSQKDAQLRADHSPTAILDGMQQNDSRWTEPIKVMRDHEIKDEKTVQIMSTFSEPPVVKESTGDETFYRRYSAGAEKKGNYLSPDHYDNPDEAREKLALPEGNTAENEAKFKIDKGTKYLDGFASPYFGQDGGGKQIYVPNDKAIHEVEE